MSTAHSICEQLYFNGNPPYLVKAMKMIRIIKYLVSIGLLFSLFSCGENPHRYSPVHRAYKDGDTLVWAQKEFDDSDWLPFQENKDNGIFWVRFDIVFDSLSTQLQHKELQVISLGSYDAYWDGHFIGSNGKVGQSEETETPGTFISYLLLPDSLAETGRHVLALRVSNYHSSSSFVWNTFRVGEYSGISNQYKTIGAFMYILAGGFLITGIYFLFTYFSQGRKKDVLIFGLVGLLFFGLIFFEYFKFFFQYEYPFHVKRLMLISIFNLSVSFLVPYFFIEHFNLPKRKLLASCLAAGFLYTLFIHFSELNYDYINKIWSTVMWWGAMLIVIFALFVRRKNAGFIFVILSLCILLYSGVFRYDIGIMLYDYDINLFLSFTMLSLAMLYLLAKNAKEQRLAYEASLVHSERLKNELLKKQLQPHFLMNTLTSLMDWVEESPERGVDFIEVLSKEFEIMTEIADEKLIPIRKEIDLCQFHIDIMRYRKEIEYV